VLHEKIKVQQGLYLLASKLGWIHTGRSETDDLTQSSDLNMLLMTEGNYKTSGVLTCIENSFQGKPDLDDFWNLESIGITNKNDAKRIDADVLECFKETLKTENGRYQITLPWKDEG
jgi:hypothetical protein